MLRFSTSCVLTLITTIVPHEVFCLNLQGNPLLKPDTFDFYQMFIDETSNKRSDPHLPDLPESSDELDSDEPLSSSEIEREMNKYQKYLAKLDEKYYKTVFKKQIDEEEKAEETYYESLLKKLKMMNIIWQIAAVCVLLSTSEGKYENVNVKMDWWETAVLYKIYTRSFMDSDGDGIGDIVGITSRLDYLKELGVDAVWLSPIFKSPNYDYGYDTIDFYTIHQDYGTMEDFEHLLKKANELDMKVILDIVFNHSSNESDWFLKSMHRDEYYSDWFIWEHGHVDAKGVRKPPNNWVSVFKESAWTYSPVRDQFYFHQFSHAEPDLNLRNPVVVDELKNILKFWLEKGVAGVLLNSVNHFIEVEKDLYGGRYPDEPVSGQPKTNSDDYGYLEHEYTKDQDENYELISQFREVFDAITVRDNMTRILLTEVSYTSIKNAVRYYGEGIQNGAHVPLNTYLIHDVNKESDARDIKYTIDKWMTYKPLKKQGNWMIGNHDKSRIGSRIRSELVDAFNMIVLLHPGIGISYMGEEIGMLDGFVPWVETRDPLACETDDPVNFVEVSRDPFRTPFQWSNGKNAGFSTNENTWLPLADGFEGLNVANQRSASRSHYQVYRTLVNLRKRPAFKLGRYESLALSHDVFAFKRWYNDDTYVIIMNVGRTYRLVNLTAFDLVFGNLEVEASSILSSRTYNDVLSASYLDLAADEALVLRMLS